MNFKARILLAKFLVLERFTLTKWVEDTAWLATNGKHENTAVFFTIRSLLSSVKQ